jgi:hypothetical protein
MAKSLFFMGGLGNATKIRKVKKKMSLAQTPASLTRAREKKQLMQAWQLGNHLVTLDVQTSKELGWIWCKSV